MGFLGMMITMVVALCCVFVGVLGQDTKLVPAIITFGDSTVDVGNNDYLTTFFKADFPPYGRDFKDQQATGRFCNGKLATDITADTLGFTTYPLAYLNPEAKGKNLLIGANFASAGSGYYDATATLSNVIPLSSQLEYFKEYQTELAKVAGSKKAKSILSGALYIVSFGSSDFLQNYYVNPVVQGLYSPDQYSSFLVEIFSNFIKDLYGLGARRIGVTTLPPLGCVPAAITLFGFGSQCCVERLNNDAKCFNKKLDASIASISKCYPHLKIGLLDIYHPLLDLATKPSKSGFAEARRGCCGTGIIETSLLCNPLSLGTCDNATEFVFWDSVHPSEAANQILANSLLLEGISLVT